MAKPTDFSTMASELHLAIASHLPPQSKVYLKLTSRHFYQTIPTLTHEELLTLERALIKKQGYDKDTSTILDTDFHYQYLKVSRAKQEYHACKDCLRLRPRDGFLLFAADQYTETRYSPHRSCFECGVKNRSKGYTPGSVIVCKGEWRIVCLDCDEFPAAEGGSERRIMGECRDCFALSDARLNAEMVGRIGGAIATLHHGLGCARCHSGFTMCQNNREDYMVRRFPSIYAQALKDGHFEVERRAAETLLESRDCMAGESPGQ